MSESLFVKSPVPLAQKGQEVMIQKISGSVLYQPNMIEVPGYPPMEISDVIITDSKGMWWCAIISPDLIPQPDAREQSRIPESMHPRRNSSTS
jgi:hypothetical protein